MSDDGGWVLRSSSGEHDVLTWRSPEGLGVVASDLTSTPGWLWPRRHALNWDRIAAFLAHPRAGYAASLFDEVQAVAPGGFSAIGADRPAEQLWRPSRFVGAMGPEGVEAERELLHRVDGCVEALTRDRGRLVVELSGGLDSSVVAGALGELGRTEQVAAWINRVGERRDGDERAYAQAVTDRLGVELMTVEKPLEALTAADFEALRASTWPALNGVDAARDRDMADRLQRAGATAIVSGQGGDAVFYQMATSWLAAEEVRRKGVFAAGTSTVAALARRLRKPVWTVVREARQALRPGAMLPPPPSPIMRPDAWRFGAAARHPWEADAVDLSLAKQLQVAGLVNSHLVRADCRRRREADILFPLLGQPLVELCLALPVETLAVGIGDRPFARRALAARLPDAILDRRAKGNLTAYFARLVMLSREALSSLLIDGCLAEAGLLDREALRRELDPAKLIWAPRPLEVLNAAAVETWVRYWQGRVPDSPSSHR